MDVEVLKRSSLAELEMLYEAAQVCDLPTGRYRGAHLRRVDEPGARRPHAVATFPFAWVPFGVDFDARCWTFFHPHLRIGRFEPRLGPSRWRDTTTVGLHYDVSRLPRAIRARLYDEVKPLSPELCLGLGGIGADRNVGDHFFFALERVA